MGVGVGGIEDIGREAGGRAASLWKKSRRDGRLRGCETTVCSSRLESRGLEVRPGAGDGEGGCGRSEREKMAVPLGEKEDQLPRDVQSGCPA